MNALYTPPTTRGRVALNKFAISNDAESPQEVHWSRAREYRGRRPGEMNWNYGGISQTYIRTIILASNLPFSDFIQVDPETVGEYIGRRDVNDAKAWEGDIVKIKHWMDERKYVYGAIKYIPEQCQFVIDCKDVEINFHSKLWFEVCGNIYDNPELLDIPFLD